MEPTIDRKIEGLRVRERIKSLDLNLSQFATLCGRSRGGVSNAITGHHSATKVPEWVIMKLEQLELTKQKPAEWRKILREVI